MRTVGLGSDLKSRDQSVELEHENEKLKAEVAKLTGENKKLKAEVAKLKKFKEEGAVMSYIDWGYYSSHFPKLTEEEFDAALAGAEVKVEIYTHFRSRTATGYKLEQVKAAVANLINTMADQNSVGSWIWCDINQ